MGSGQLSMYCIIVFYCSILTIETLILISFIKGSILIKVAYYSFPKKKIKILKSVKLK